MTTSPYDQDGLHVAEPLTMRTYSGRKIDPFKIMPTDIVLADIAHALARTCRYNGHSVGHLSVARHSIHVHDWVHRHGGTSGEALAGLMHDAAEAYIGDVIRPLKARPEFQFFRDLDDTITAVVLAACNVDFTSLPEIVHEADRQITLAEINLDRYTYEGDAARDEAEFYQIGFNHIADVARRLP